MNDEHMLGLSVLKFSAEWCAPCKRLETIIEKMKKEFSEIMIYNVDIDNDFETAKKYKVKSVPCLVFFEEGKEFSRINGLEKTEIIRKAFKSLLSSKGK